MWPLFYVSGGGRGKRRVILRHKLQHTKLVHKVCAAYPLARILRAEPDTSAQEPGPFKDFGSADQKQRFAQHWHEEEQQRAAAFDRLPPEPRAIPLAGSLQYNNILYFALVTCIVWCVCLHTNIRIYAHAVRDWSPEPRAIHLADRSFTCERRCHWDLFIYI